MLPHFTQDNSFLRKEVLTYISGLIRTGHTALQPCQYSFWHVLITLFQKFEEFLSNLVSMDFLQYFVRSFIEVESNKSIVKVWAHLLQVVDEMLQIADSKGSLDRRKVVNDPPSRQRLGFGSIIQEYLPLAVVMIRSRTSMASCSFSCNGHLANSNMISISSPFNFCRYKTVCSGPRRFSSIDAELTDIVSGSGSSCCPNDCNSCSACR